jgi:hypothetical protein
LAVQAKLAILVLHEKKIPIPPRMKVMDWSGAIEVDSFDMTKEGTTNLLARCKAFVAGIQPQKINELASGVQLSLLSELSFTQAP